MISDDRLTFQVNIYSGYINLAEIRYKELASGGIVFLNFDDQDSYLFFDKYEQREINDVVVVKFIVDFSLKQLEQYQDNLLEPNVYQLNVIDPQLIQLIQASDQELDDL